MNRQLIRLAVAFLIALVPLAAAQAAETAVRVALLDMTAMGGRYGAGMMRPDGRGFGPGMMGGGMMGGGMEPGTMPPGQGYGPGPGIMGPGMMMGRGMMMHGMMAIRADRPSVPAGKVVFDVTNWSSSVVHEMLVVAVDGPDAPLPYDYDTGRVIEDQVRSMGETAEMAPLGSGRLELDLKPGSYLLICNLPYHYAAGMVLPFTVAAGG